MSARRGTWGGIADELRARLERQAQVHADHLLDVARWLRDTGYPVDWLSASRLPHDPIPACMVVPLAMAYRERDLARKADGELEHEEVAPLEEYVDFIAEQARGDAPDRREKA